MSEMYGPLDKSDRALIISKVDAREAVPNKKKVDEQTSSSAANDTVVDSPASKETRVRHANYWVAVRLLARLAWLAVETLRWLDDS